MATYSSSSNMREQLERHQTTSEVTALPTTSSTSERSVHSQHALVIDTILNAAAQSDMAGLTSQSYTSSSSSSPTVPINTAHMSNERLVMEYESSVQKKTKRILQNRIAQRAYRERREKYIKALEDQVSEMQRMKASLQAAYSEIDKLRLRLAEMETERVKLLAQRMIPPQHHDQIRADMLPLYPSPTTTTGYSPSVQLHPMGHTVGAPNNPSGTARGPAPTNAHVHYHPQHVQPYAHHPPAPHQSHHVYTASPPHTQSAPTAIDNSGVPPTPVSANGPSLSPRESALRLPQPQSQSIQSNTAQRHPSLPSLCELCKTN